MIYEYKIEKDNRFGLWQVIREDTSCKDIILEEDDLEDLEEAIKGLIRLYKEDPSSQIDSIKLAYLLEDLEEYEQR